MSHVAVHIWGSVYTDSSFLDTADNAIATLNSQVDFDVYGYVEDNGFYSDAGTWNGKKDDFVPYVEDKLGGAPHDIDCHLMIVDDTDLGAGKAWGHTNYGGSQFSDGKASMAGANAAVKAYVNSTCEGDGKTAFKNTVIQEACHTIMKEKFYDSDYPESGNEHSIGAVYSYYSDNPVSPMETWYTRNNCGFNDSVNVECGDNTPEYRHAYSTNMSYCAVDAAEDYYNKVF